MKILRCLKNRCWLFLRPKKKNRKENPSMAVTSKIVRPLFLYDIFKSEKKYLFIMDVFVNQGLCSAEDYRWIDKGQGKKGLIVVLLKLLQVEDYYKEKFKLTHKQIIEISQNTFGINIGIDHIKHTKYNSIMINYIPHSSTLD